LSSPGYGDPGLPVVLRTKGKLMPHGKRVLVIEDHDDSRIALTRVLRRYGFTVTDYDRCKPAEKHLETCDLDIALLDVRMPERCGDDYGRELRERCPKTMIVFLTGEALVEPLKEKVPDCFVLRKPVDCAVLLELLTCFKSDTAYDSPMSKEADDRARPGNMG
jgi:DNA-binding response OmpR family regulator